MSYGRKSIWAALCGAILAIGPAPVSAQSFLPFFAQYGYVPTPGQWVQAFQAKQDVLGYTALNKAGDIMLGGLGTVASSAAGTGFNILPGIAPSSPNNGDMWATSSGLFVQIGGATSELTTPAGNVLTVGAPIVGGTPSGLLLNNGGNLGNSAALGSGVLPALTSNTGTSGGFQTGAQVSSSIATTLPSTTAGQIVTTTSTAGRTSAVTPGTGVSGALTNALNASGGLLGYGGPAAGVNYTQGGTSALSRSIQNWAQDRISVMDFCTAAQAATDITTCAQNAINAAAAQIALNSGNSGGKCVYYPAQYSPYNLLGTLVISTSFVCLDGENPQTSYINCANGASDCVQLGQPAPAANTRDQRVTNLGIIGNGSKTAGAGIHIQNTYNALVQRVNLDNMIRGADVDTGNNTVTLRDVVMTVNQPTSDYGIYWHDAATGATRSDQLILDNVAISGQNYAGSTTVGIQWDGLANTMSMHHVAALQLNYGLRVVNSAASASYFPAFLNADDLECEGAKQHCVSIEGGEEFKFVNSDITNAHGVGAQGSADGSALQVLADAGASITHGVEISNSRLGASGTNGLSSAARDVQLSNVQFFGTSLSGTYPVIDVLGTTNDFQATNIRCQEFGSSLNANYCVQIESGATGVQAHQIDARYVTTGAINDLGGSQTGYADLIEPNSYTGTNLNRINQPTTGTLAFGLANPSVGVGVVSQWQLSTGSANSTAYEALHDNNGTPYYQTVFGSGVGTWYQDVNTHVWRNTAGVTLATLNASGLAIVGEVSATAHIATGTAPTGTTGSCAASSFVGGATAGKFSAVICTAGTIILSALPAAPTGYACEAQDMTTPSGTLKQTAYTTTSVTFQATTIAAADAVIYYCMGF
jgi:hypothetical protein